MTEGNGGADRFDRLFADLEAEQAAAEREVLLAESQQRARSERGRLRLVDRMAATGLGPLTVTLLGGHELCQPVQRVGPDWIQLGTPPTTMVANLACITSVRGLGPYSRDPSSESIVDARFDLRLRLRGLARDRSPLRVFLADGAVSTGTIDGVGADHVDLAEHQPGQARRSRSVALVRTLPINAIALVGVDR